MFDVDLYNHIMNIHLSHYVSSASRMMWDLPSVPIRIVYAVLIFQSHLLPPWSAYTLKTLIPDRITSAAIRAHGI